MCKFVNNTKRSRIDRCMKPFMSMLNLVIDRKYEIVACCCGHKKYPMTIIIRRIGIGYYYDLVSGAPIPRKRNFYKKDKSGYFYIPEAMALYKRRGGVKDGNK